MTGNVRKGTYLLFLCFREPHTISVGSLGTLNVGAGEYCYVGSAMNGLESRLERHMRKEKKMHWHIDRLTVQADTTEAYVPSEPTGECVLSAAAGDSGCIPVFEGFGSSDCRCRTHLFMTDGRSKQKLLTVTAAYPFMRAGM